jgi:DNA-binding winged helix-turn-helix (wHTH) protein
MFSFREDSKMTTETKWISDPITMSFVFGSFRLLPTQRLLIEGDKPVHLGSRAFDILVALLERPGELVSKEELMAKVWPNTFVASPNLAVHISALRRALGEERNRYVINIPGRGYRFVAPVRVEKDLSEVNAPTHKHNVPADFSQPSERTEIIDELAQQLRPRMLAILGRAGIDKTKAALAVVEKLIEAPDDGWLVDLTSRENG